MRAAIALAVGLLVTSAARDAVADPQGNAGLTVGAAGVGLDRAVWDDTVFHLGLRGDVLFGRDRGSDFAAGPYAEVFTHAFDELQLGAGVSGLVPIVEYLPVVVSVGGYGRIAEEGFEPGVATSLFFGTRSYNFHSGYGMAAGILGQFRYGLGDSRETAVVIAAHLDLVALSLPFQFLINAARGGSEETESVR